MTDKIEIDLPKEIIDAHVRAAVMRALGENPDKLIEAVVNTAMSQKSSSYGHKTIFEEAVNAAIRDEAESVFNEWLVAKRDVIRFALTRRLKAEEAGFVDAVAERIVSGMASSIKIDVKFGVDLKE